MFPLAITDYKLQQVTDDEWVLFEACHSYALPLKSEVVPVLQACDGKTSEAALAERFGLTPERLSEVLDFLRANELLISDSMPEVRADLITSAVGEETVVYDPRTTRGFALDKTATQVFQRCDGETPIAEVAREFGTEGQAVVNDALVKLADEGLLKKRRCGIDRREFLSKAAQGAMLMAVLVPRPAAAASPCPGGCFTFSSCDGSASACLLCCDADDPYGTGNICQGNTKCGSFAMTFSSATTIFTADGFGCYQSAGAAFEINDCTAACGAGTGFRSYICCTNGKFNLGFGENCLFCGVRQSGLCSEPTPVARCCGAGTANDSTCGYLNGSACAANNQCCSNNCAGLVCA